LPSPPPTPPDIRVRIRRSETLRLNADRSARGQCPRSVRIQVASDDRHTHPAVETMVAARPAPNLPTTPALEEFGRLCSRARRIDCFSLDQVAGMFLDLSAIKKTDPIGVCRARCVYHFGHCSTRDGVSSAGGKARASRCLRVSWSFVFRHRRSYRPWLLVVPPTRRLRREYANLEIQEGGQASLEYLRVHFGNVPVGRSAGKCGSSLSATAARTPRGWSGSRTRCESTLVDLDSKAKLPESVARWQARDP